jgi:transposase-like protein
VSENFIEASREKVKQLMERPPGELRLCAVLIDGTPFKDRQMIVALGIGCDGRKTVAGPCAREQLKTRPSWEHC